MNNFQFQIIWAYKTSDIFCVKKGKYFLHNHAVFLEMTLFPPPHLNPNSKKRIWRTLGGLVPAKTNAKMLLALETSLRGRDGKRLWKGPDSECLRFCRLHRVSVANFFHLLNKFSNPFKNVESILSSGAIPKQTLGRIW